MRGLVPNTINAENKLKWGLSFKRLLVLLVAFMFSSQIGSFFVHLHFQLVFPLLSVVAAFWLTTKDPINPTKALWEGLFDYYYSRFGEPKKYSSILGSAYELHREGENKNV